MRMTPEPGLLVMLTDVRKAGPVADLEPTGMRIYVETSALITAGEGCDERTVGLLLPDELASKLAVAVLLNMEPAWRKRTLRLLRKLSTAEADGLAD